MMTWFVRHFPHLYVWCWLAFSRDPQARWARFMLKAGLLRRWSAFKRGIALDSLVFAVRDIIATSKLTRNSATGLNLGSIAAPAAGAAFTQANGQQFTVRKAHKFLILVYNSKAGAINVIIRAGVYPPALDAGKGDLTIPVGTTVFFTVLGPFDSARFQQADGSIWVDTDAAATGIMWPFEVPA